MIPRQHERKIRTGPSWCVVDLNAIRDQRVALNRLLMLTFAEEIDSFERENIDEVLGLEFVEGRGWMASAGAVSVANTGKGDCITQLMTSYEEQELEPPASAEHIGARLAVVEGYRARLARQERTLAALAGRPDQAPLNFRKPAASRLQRAVEWARGRRDLKARSSQLEQAGAIIGATWAHELHDLEATFPRDATDDALLDYSEEVQMELVEHGLTTDEMMALFNAITDDLINPHQRDAEEARKLVGFGSTGAPPGVTTSPSPASA